MLKLLKLWRTLGDRMDVHKNARLTPAGREIMVRRVVEGGQTPEALSAAVGVCPRTVRKWVKRFRAEGLAGLQDRSSRSRRRWRLGSRLPVRTGSPFRSRDVRFRGSLPADYGTSTAAPCSAPVRRSVSAWFACSSG